MVFVSSLIALTIVRAQDTPVSIIQASQSRMSLKDADLFGEKSVFESTSDEKPGIVVVQRPSDDEVDIHVAMAGLRSTKVVAIATKDSKGKIIVWDGQWNLLPQAGTSLKSSVKNMIEKGKLAVKYVSKVDDRPKGLSVMQVGPFNSFYTKDNGIATNWFVMDKQSIPYVNIALTVIGSNDLGAISSDPGTSVVLGGATISVDILKSDDANLRDSGRTITIDGKDQKKPFSFLPVLDPSVSKEKRRMSDMVSLTSQLHAEMHAGENQSKNPKVIHVQSMFPTKMWPKITVSTRYELFGYFCHVPMAPRKGKA